MHISEISISTITLARNAHEEQVLRAALSRLMDMGVTVAVSDGGSGPEFARFLAGLPRVRIAEPPARGLVPQVRSSLAAAYALETPFILYTEPDKLSFFDQSIARFVERAPGRPTVGVVMASRSDGSFSTYPPLQRFTESTINTLCADIVGQPADYSYGPFLLNRALVPHIERVSHDIGWGWRHFMFGIARRLDFDVRAIADDYPCPADQRNEDDRERIHRMRQLSQNIAGLVLSQTIDP